MKIVIKTIAHSRQRYPTVGDLYTQKGVLYITVSKMTDWRYELLVAVHELVEVSLCKHRGIKQAEVDAFDIAFEKNRLPGNTDEPGSDPDAPYQREHWFATNLESLLAAELDVNWFKYEKAVNSLP